MGHMLRDKRSIFKKLDKTEPVMRARIDIEAHYLTCKIHLEKYQPSEGNN